LILSAVVPAGPGAGWLRTSGLELGIGGVRFFGRAAHFVCAILGALRMFARKRIRTRPADRTFLALNGRVERDGLPGIHTHLVGLSEGSTRRWFRLALTGGEVNQRSSSSEQSTHALGCDFSVRHTPRPPGTTLLPAGTDLVAIVAPIIATYRHKKTDVADPAGSRPRRHSLRWQIFN
jgi:hypothetical protein